MLKCWVFSSCLEAHDPGTNETHGVYVPSERIVGQTFSKHTRIDNQQGHWILLMKEILHQLIGSSSHYLHGLIHPRWCRICSISSIIRMANLKWCNLDDAISIPHRVAGQNKRPLLDAPIVDTVRVIVVYPHYWPGLLHLTSHHLYDRTVSHEAKSTTTTILFGWGQLPPRLRSLGQRDQRSNSDFKFFATPNGKSIFWNSHLLDAHHIDIHNIEANLLFHDPFIQLALKSLKSVLLNFWVTPVRQRYVGRSPSWNKDYWETKVVTLVQDRMLYE